MAGRGRPKKYAKDKEDKQIHAMISQGLRARVEKYVKETHVPLTGVVILALQLFLDEHDKAKDAAKGKG